MGVKATTSEFSATHMNTLERACDKCLLRVTCFELRVEKLNTQRVTRNPKRLPLSVTQLLSVRCIFEMGSNQRYEFELSRKHE